MPTWNLRLTPPGAPETTLADVPQSDFHEFLRALMAGEPTADAAARLSADEARAA